MKCAKCGQEVVNSGNLVRLRLWGANAALHWRCFGKFLRDGAGDQLEHIAWEASALTTVNHPAAARARGEKLHDEPK
jgi:hypothetical protein